MATPPQWTSHVITHIIIITTLTTSSCSLEAYHDQARTNITHPHKLTDTQTHTYTHRDTHTDTDNIDDTMTTHDGPLTAVGSRVNLSNAIVVKSCTNVPRCSTYANMLVSEVARRTSITWAIKDDPSGIPSGTPTIDLHVDSTSTSISGRPFSKNATDEGYSISSSRTGSVQIVGWSERGLLFGVGRLLRLLNVSRFEGYKIPYSASILLQSDLSISSSPDNQIRGHQLGYRPKTNAYDGWNAAQYEQYIVELSMFGTNYIELIPWKTDDVPYSPMFTETPQTMLASVSAVCDKYGIMCGLWYPLMEKNYSDPDTLSRAMLEWSEVFGLMKRLDAVQIPAGDPGSKPPDEMLGVAKLFASKLKRAFPNSTLWIGPQEWSKSEMLEWNKAIQNAQWIDGLVYGPHTSIDLATFVETSPNRYPIRLYPDITHTLSTQYPVPNWDRALAITESRESINPRPTQYGTIATAHLALVKGVGFSSYSEGCNDDINKIVWSYMSWGADRESSSEGRTAAKKNGTDLALTAVRDFANLFFGSELADNITQVILGLEAAWNSPLLGNNIVQNTQNTIKNIELNYQPSAALNWRLQQLRYRAHYDSFIQVRLERETHMEEEALSLLDPKNGLPPAQCIDAAMAVLNGSVPKYQPSAEELAMRQTVEVIAGELFHSIRMQLSVTKYFAEYTVRGANLDTADLPLNNAPYLLQQLAAIKALPDSKKWDALKKLTHWADVGEDGFYDDLGDPMNQPHLVVPTQWENDPDYYHNPLNARAIARDLKWSDRFEKPAAALDIAPTQWQTVVNTFYNAPLMLRYEGLEQGGNYTVVVVYVDVNDYMRRSIDQLGSTPPPTTNLTANGFLVHDQLPPPSPQQRLSFRIPPSALATSTSLELIWQMPNDVGGSGCGNEVAEVLIIKN